MYGWLSSENTHHAGEIAVLIPNWEPITATTLTQAQRNSRMAKLMPFVQAALAQDTTATRNRLFLVLQKLITLPPEGLVEFALYMCVAHERLPDRERAARHAAIAETLDSYFAGPSNPDDRLAKLLENTREIATLIPDAVLKTRLRTICTQIRSDIFSNPQTVPPAYAGLRNSLAELAALCKRSGNPREDAMCGELVKLLLSRPTAQLGAVQMQIRELVGRGLGEVMTETMDRQAARPGLPTIMAMDALACIIEDTLSQGKPARWSEIIDPQLELAWALHDAQHNRVLLASVAAVRAGVPMGNERTRQSLAALQTLQDSLHAFDQTMTPERVRTARQQRAKPRPEPSAPSGDSVDAVQSWSIDRLVRWIEGPVTNATIRQPIDRRKIVAREQDARRQGGVARGATPPTETLTEADVGGMIDDAISATAHFFLSDLKELMPMAEALGADEKAMAVCAGVRESLAKLAEQPSGMDEVSARNLLQTTETATAALRASVKRAQATAQVEKRFALQLGVALSSEPLVMGKRHGGVVQCPVRPGDWSFVSTNFHRRWLPRVNSITVEGKTWPLDSDQAVALYVTASSLSQYAFDVSAHLWRRRPGCNSLPGLGSELYPPMNEQDWFDTYIPCCVLHVPQAG